MIPPLSLLLLAPAVLPQGPPTGYYDTVDTTSAATLRATLHEVIDDHQRFPYTSGSTDTWDILEEAQEDPSNASRILDVYRNRSLVKQGGGNSLYNREHTWPNSYGFPDDFFGNYAYTDCHQLFLCDIGYNSQRENKPYQDCSSSCSQFTTDANNGQGGGSGGYPGNSNWTSGSNTNGRWETWIGRRGDVARALLYMDVRYEGGNHSTGVVEPDLILTDQISLIAGSNTGSNENIAYMGYLQTLLQWHEQDPVDAFEERRNDVVFSFQGNRNPFIDHPEWVACIFEDNCGAEPIEAYCFGVGCPCGNDDAMAGCLNSTGSGATLINALGTPSVSADDLALVAVSLPTQQNGLLYMGGAPISVPFGDGLRCVGAGTTGIFRYPVRGTGLQGAIFEGPGLVAYSQSNFPMAGLIEAGDSWYFQCWYRDPGGSCGSAFNLSNGLRVTFAP